MDNPTYVIDCEREFGTSPSKCKPAAGSREYSFEEAITLAGVGRFHVKLLLICGLCFMAVMVETMGVSLILPLVNCDLDASLEEQGILASAGFLGVVLSSHAMGFLADTLGRVTLLRCVVLLSAVSSILSAFSASIWMLIVCRFLTGLFISGVQACVFSLCGEFHGNSSRVRHVILLSCFMCIAMMCAPALAIGILPLELRGTWLGLDLYSWRLFLLAQVSVSVLALIGLFSLPETPKYQLVQGRVDEALSTLRIIFAQNTRRSASEYPVERLTPQLGGASLSSVHSFCDAVRLIWQQTVPLFHRCRVLHTLNICVMQFFIYVIAHGIFMWFPTILNQLTKASSRGSPFCSKLQSFDAPMNSTGNLDSCHVATDNETYQMMIAVGGAFTVIYLILAYTVDLVGKRNLIVVWMVMTIGCLALVHWLQDYALIVIALTLTMAIGNCGGLVNTMAMEFYPTQVNAMGMCLIMMVGRLGAVVGSSILGRFMFSSCDTTFWALLAVVVVLTAMVFYLPDHTKRKSKARPRQSSISSK